MRAYIFIAMVAMVATYLYTPLIRHLAIQLGAVGEVRARDVHTVPTPRMGGVAMLLGFITAMFFASRLNFLQGEFRQNHQAWVVMAGAAMICLLGVADDVWDLDWMLKLAGQLLISVFVAWGGLQIISLPIGGLLTASPMISIAITALLIVVSINAVNFVDGLDGLAAGIVAIGGIAFGIYSYVLSRQQVSYASMATLVDVAMVGICLGFLLHNWHPAKLFMGTPVRCCSATSSPARRSSSPGVSIRRRSTPRPTCRHSCRYCCPCSCCSCRCSTCSWQSHDACARGSHPCIPIACICITACSA